MAPTDDYEDVLNVKRMTWELDECPHLQDQIKREKIIANDDDNDDDDDDEPEVIQKKKKTSDSTELVCGALDSNKELPHARENGSIELVTKDNFLSLDDDSIIEEHEEDINNDISSEESAAEEEETKNYTQSSDESLSEEENTKDESIVKKEPKEEEEDDEQVIDTPNSTAQFSKVLLHASTPMIGGNLGNTNNKNSSSRLGQSIVEQLQNLSSQNGHVSTKPHVIDAHFDNDDDDDNDDDGDIRSSTNMFDFDFGDITGKGVPKKQYEELSSESSDEENSPPDDAPVNLFDFEFENLKNASGKGFLQKMEFRWTDEIDKENDESSSSSSEDDTEEEIPEKRDLDKATKKEKKKKKENSKEQFNVTETVVEMEEINSDVDKLNNKKEKKKKKKKQAEDEIEEEEEVAETELQQKKKKKRDKKSKATESATETKHHTPQQSEALRQKSVDVRNERTKQNKELIQNALRGLDTGDNACSSNKIRFSDNDDDDSDGDDETQVKPPTNGSGKLWDEDESDEALTFQHKHKEENIIVSSPLI